MTDHTLVTTSSAGSAAGQDEDPGWAGSISRVRCHYVAAGAARDQYAGRETGVGICGSPGLIDEAGLADRERLPHCHSCTRRLRGVRPSRDPE